MIESCSKKRMLLGIFCLGGLTLVVLVVESHWTDQNTHHIKSVDNSSKAESQCWQAEKFEITEPCHPCTDFEIASKSVEVCLPTHFKEGVKCKISGLTYRSCSKVKWIEERKYWIFESVMFVLAVLAYSVVYYRQKVLDKRVVLRVQKQLANGLVS